MAVSRNAFSVSAARSSEIGSGPSLSSPLAALNARGSVTAGPPGTCGIRGAKMPLDSSHEFTDVLAAVSLVEDTEL